MTDDGWIYGETRFNEDTLQKVYDALSLSGYSFVQTINIVNTLQKAGILFRERTED